ncbi:ABC transporter substrate-binding protein [Kribbia dieselivorans]|uniref:ABC transporter substrate-binding protein n=1 Tax=Kribbia dieselivorans TaxID=331526 RepID=UPI000839A4E4|nr:ABC transporter substrate-binding protein [Kribbia dieselivorans]
MKRRLPVAMAMTAVLAVAVAACDEGGGGPAELGAPSQDVTVLSQGTIAAWDPQRLSNPDAAAVASRLWMRTLTTHPGSSEVAKQVALVGDLATDTGTSSNGGRRWRFTLRKGLTWQDGSALTCADLVHGVARGFDPDLGGGSGYALAYLDIPKNKDGSSSYKGPFRTKKGGPSEKAFNEAVSCQGNTITYVLSEPVGDFDEMVSRPEFAPVAKASDRRADGLHAARSSGPYKLEKAWTPGTGGTFVRNPKWKASSDPVRKANVNSFVIEEGASPDRVVSALRDTDRGRTTLVLDPAPPVVVEQVRQSTSEGVTILDEPNRIVDYLAPNHSRGPMKNAKVRRAFALATDRAAYAAALGGDEVARPVDSLLTTVVPSHHSAAMPAAGGADVPTAKTGLRQAKVSTPVKVSVTYRSDERMDEAMKALLPTWRRAGFEVTLKPITEDYFTTIAKAEAGKQTDVFWANWAAEWPSASTVLPPLFDSRMNLQGSSAGRDYGLLRDAGLNADFDEAAGLARGAKRAKAWSTIDIGLLKSGGYVPLAQHRSTHLAGASIGGLTVNQALGGVLDLSTVKVTP